MNEIPLPARYHVEFWQPQIDEAQSFSDLEEVEQQTRDLNSAAAISDALREMMSEEMRGQEFSRFGPLYELDEEDEREVKRSKRLEKLREELDQRVDRAGRLVHRHCFVAMFSGPFVSEALPRLPYGDGPEMVDQTAMALFTNPSFPLAVVNLDDPNKSIRRRLNGLMTVSRPPRELEKIDLYVILGKWSRQSGFDKALNKARDKLRANGLRYLNQYADDVLELTDATFPQMVIYWWQWEELWGQLYAAKNFPEPFTANPKLAAAIDILGLSENENKS